MKKELKDVLAIAAVLFAFSVLICVAAVGCLFLLVALEPNPLDSTGSYDCVAYCSDYGFQDGMSYREYRYTQASFEDSPFFQPVTLDNMGKIRAFVEDYEDWVDLEKDSTKPEAQELYQRYRYNIATLSKNDYFYLNTEGSDYPFEQYDLYIFDAEGMTLYCLESSI